MAKRSAILQQGLHLYADVQDCYTTSLSAVQFTLVKLRLSIPIKDKVSVETVSSAFVSGDAKQLVRNGFVFAFCLAIFRMWRS